MASLRLFSRSTLNQSSAILRRCFFGSSCLRVTDAEKDGNSAIKNESKKHHAKVEISDKSAPSFSIDEMILESATDSSDKNNEQEFEDDYYYDSEDELKSQILKTALEYVPEHSWTHEALKRAAEAEGLSSAVEDLFPRGPGDLVLYFIEDCNATLAEHLLHEAALRDKDAENIDMPKMSTNTFIQDAIIARLQMLRPYIHTWPQAVRLLMQPNTAPEAMENLAHMVDEIWYHAGDTSTDLNWYSKRGSLAAIYGASELYMTQDRSEDFQCTWKFVQQRIENANQLKNISNSLQDLAANASTILSSAISTAQNITGNNCRKR